MEKIKLPKIPGLRGPRHESLMHARNNREDLVNQIAEATTEKNKKLLAKRIAIAANTFGWTNTDLHTLLAKKKDPTIRNFTAFVKWSIKIKSKSS